MKHLFLLLCTCAAIPIAAQSYQQQCNDLVSKKDTAAQRQLLEKWALADSSDAELYVAYFNYYANKSHSSMLELGRKPKGKEALTLTDSTKKTVGYLYGNSSFDPVILQKGFDWIDKGIQKFPARLDMRFGKVYMYGKVEDYEDFTTELVKAIDYSAVIKNKWSWSNGKPLNDPEKFLLGNVQTYVLQLYNTGNDSLLGNMKQISEAVLKQYPDHVESLSDLAIVYMLREQYDEALTALLKAEKLAPKDAIVLNNIAQAYKRKGDKKNAVTYYKKVEKYGNDEEKEFAKKQLEELK